jgi:hypothetical protein
LVVLGLKSPELLVTQNLSGRKFEASYQGKNHNLPKCLLRTKITWTV